MILNLLFAKKKKKSRRLDEVRKHWMDGEKKWWQNFGLGVIVFVWGFSLRLARFYNVLEAYVSIWEMLVSAY